MDMGRRVKLLGEEGPQDVIGPAPKDHMILRTVSGLIPIPEALTIKLSSRRIAVLSSSVFQ